MAYTLGIDVGTSFTAAAVCRRSPDGHEPAVAVDLGTYSTTAPSVVLVDDDRWLFGDLAEQRTRDRPELVVREFKRRVGDPVPLVVGDRRLTPEALVAGMIGWVVEQVAAREGGPPDAVAVTHPAAWGEGERELVRAALSAVGHDEAIFVADQIAAAAHHAAQRGAADGTTVAVYDLGGGTFDAAVVRKEADGVFSVLGAPYGITLGGADFDQAILDHVRRTAGLRPAGPADPATLAAVARLHRQCVEAKEALSADLDATITVELPGRCTDVRLVRVDIEASLLPLISQTADAFAETVAAAGVEPAELDAVLLLGGSSRIPLVTELASARLGRPIRIADDPKAPVALGAATIAAAKAFEPVRTPQPVPVVAAIEREAAVSAPADLPSRPGRAPTARRWSSTVLAAAAVSAVVAASAMAVNGAIRDPRPQAAEAETAEPPARADAASSPSEVSSPTTEPPGTAAHDSIVQAARPADAWPYRFDATLSEVQDVTTTRPPAAAVPVSTPTTTAAAAPPTPPPTTAAAAAPIGGDGAVERSARTVDPRAVTVSPTDRPASTDTPRVSSPTRPTRPRRTTGTTPRPPTTTATTTPTTTAQPVPAAPPPVTTAAPPVTPAAPPQPDPDPPAETPPVETPPMETEPPPADTEPPPPTSSGSDVPAEPDPTSTDSLPIPPLIGW